MTTMTGQLDLFEASGEQAPIPLFTVWTCVWATGQRCGWCDGKGIDGGGACRNPEDDTESFFYQYCRPCREKYGYPKVTREGFPLVIDRTQKPRPFDAPDLGGRS